MKKSPEQEKHFTQSRKGPEGAKKTGQFFFARLCVLAPWRELFDFFTRSKPWESKPKRRSSLARGGRTRQSSRLETFSFAPAGLNEDCVLVVVPRAYAAGLSRRAGPPLMG